MNKQRRFDAEKSVKRTLMLALFLLAGVLAGLVLSGTLPEEELQYLREYLLRRRESLEELSVRDSVWQTLWAYLRGIAWMLVLGICTANPLPLLFVCLGQGFSLSFAAASLVQSLGTEGFLVALGALLFRCLFLLSATLYLAGTLLEQWAWQKRDRNSLARCAVVCVLLALLGAVCELIFTPAMLRYFLS